MKSLFIFREQPGNFLRVPLSGSSVLFCQLGAVLPLLCRCSGGIFSCSEIHSEEVWPITLRFVNASHSRGRQYDGIKEYISVWIPAWAVCLALLISLTLWAESHISHMHLDSRRWKRKGHLCVPMWHFWYDLPTGFVDPLTIFSYALTVVCLKEIHGTENKGMFEAVPL